ncbi:T9SS type A sorting domain-containing protein [Flavobacterium sp.]|uniref:T9SS type A sorting domain-containing protein n=1 Tax=Flavobacterium sp. TaxID=239 RepID=UPI00403480E2
MMKKLLFAAGMFVVGTAMMFAQNIGIIGDATPGVWATDTDMVTADGVVYTLENFTLTSGTVKFRENDSWTNNWGGTTWPSGVGAFNSSNNIPSQPGVYNITFNRTTLEYNFEDAGNFDDVDVMMGATAVSMFTLDGVTYRANNVVFENAGTATFRFNATDTWGGTAFPSGTATMGGAAISVPANSYNISYNTDTHAYSFDFVMISITGDAVGGWGTVDVDMQTTNGFDYTVNDVTFTAAEWKFRLNHDWGTTWGNATFPSGTVTIVGDGGNIMATAGTYDGTFNRSTGVFAFTESTNGTKDFNSRSITVYPNPSNNVWNFNAGNNTISSMQIVDVTGKVVYTAAVNATAATVNASGFASGMYFARLTSGNATETVRVVKN